MTKEPLGLCLERCFQTKHQTTRGPYSALETISISPELQQGSSDRVHRAEPELVWWTGTVFTIFAPRELSRRVGKACRGKGIRSDYGSVRLVLVLVGILLVGARRLEHLQYVCDDPMLLRFCGLRRLPSRPTIVNWLKQFTGERLKGLSELNGVLVHEQIERLGLNRLTVDMDGTVVQAGNQVGWAFRGFNPHRKKNKKLLPFVRSPGSDGPDSQIQKSSWQRSRLQGCRCVSTGTDRRATGPVRSVPKAGIPHGRRVFHEKILKRLERSRSEFRAQGSVLAVARPKGGRRWAQAMAPRE